MKGRDLETLLYLGKIEDSWIEYCSDDKANARVVARINTGEEVSTFCIPIRAAGKINTVIKHYLRMGITKYLVTDDSISKSNVDTEGGEDEVREDENSKE
ncbi:hypothetical protein HS7_09440 [Sulfolobales archaeon HS-7]|nr:hypothetical protein HS7_09440 [Sulfolobales archaeon HS-7]